MRLLLMLLLHLYALDLSWFTCCCCCCAVGAGMKGSCSGPAMEGPGCAAVTQQPGRHISCLLLVLLLQ